MLLWQASESEPSAEDCTIHLIDIKDTLWYLVMKWLTTNYKYSTQTSLYHILCVVQSPSAHSGQIFSRQEDVLHTFIYLRQAVCVVLHPHQCVWFGTSFKFCRERFAMEDSSLWNGFLSFCLRLIGRPICCFCRTLQQISGSRRLSDLMPHMDHFDQSTIWIADRGWPIYTNIFKSTWQPTFGFLRCCNADTSSWKIRELHAKEANSKHESSGSQALWLSPGSTVSLYTNSIQFHLIPVYSELLNCFPYLYNRFSSSF